jgi:glutathione S-transferase
MRSVTKWESETVMELYGSLRSPYVRKVRCVAKELGIDEQISLKTATNTPQITDPVLDDVTPIGKIPVLRLPDGEIILDSLLICERLDALTAVPRLLGTGPARSANLFLHTVGDGMIDAAFRWVAEEWRPGDAMSKVIQNLMIAKLKRSLDWLDARDLNATQPMLGEITVAIALAYIDFRCESLEWRNGRSSLAGWYQKMAVRQSMQSTVLDGEGVVMSARV